MTDYIRTTKGMWLTNVQFLGGGVTQGKAYQLTSGEGDVNQSLLYEGRTTPATNGVNDFGFADDEGRERYSSTNPTLFIDEWRLSTPEEIENAQD